MSTALVLGGGAARGWAHLGVIRALTEKEIPIDFVAGTSIGALVGAVYAAGNIDSFRADVLKIDWKRVLGYLDFVFPKSGLIDGRKINNFIRTHVSASRFEDLPLPFCSVATDMFTGREIVQCEGDLVQAVRASIAIPGIFTPVEQGELFLVDGGLVNPVPVSVARENGADFVIAVDLNHEFRNRRNNSGKKDGPGAGEGNSSAAIASTSPIGVNLGRNRLIVELNKRLAGLRLAASQQFKQLLNRDDRPNIYEVLAASINIIESRITAARLVEAPPDLLIRPKLAHIHLLGFDRAEEAIDRGYQAAMASLKSFVP